jgi:hypothetical protein
MVHYQSESMQPILVWKDLLNSSPQSKANQWIRIITKSALNAVACRLLQMALLFMGVPEFGHESPPNGSLSHLTHQPEPKIDEEYQNQLTK